jgi:hypothetical protein
MAWPQNNADRAQKCLQVQDISANTVKRGVPLSQAGPNLPIQLLPGGFGFTGFMPPGLRF